MPNENDDSQLDIDSLFTTDDSEPDIFSQAADIVDPGELPSGDLSSVVDPFAASSTLEVPEDGASTEIPEVAAEEAEEAEEEEPEAPEKGKKAKKAKKEKPAKKEKAAKKEKPAKVKKEKAPAAKKEKAVKPKEPKGDYVASPSPFFLLGAVILCAIVVANILALISFGASCLLSLVIFDVLGLFALAIVYLYLSQLRKTYVDLWSFWIALSGIAMVFACMAQLFNLMKFFS